MTARSALQVRDLRVSFPAAGRGRRARFAAVDDVSLTLPAGGSLGLVGESGCGKSTLARAIVGEVAPDSGEIVVGDSAVAVKRHHLARRQLQMVFQDPMSSLNPRMTVRQVLSELLRVHRMVPAGEREARCRNLLAEVGLSAEALDVLPSALSGGQRQRVSIARALAVEPEILIADEITSALDVSIQAQVLALLLRLQQQLGLSMLFISHNLAVVRQICDRVAVMYLGRIVEEGPTEQIFCDPQHPYTRLLLASVPRLSGAPMTIPVAAAEPLGSAVVSGGCRFRPRCPIARDICQAEDPTLPRQGDLHVTACHFPVAGADLFTSERTA